MEYVLALAKAGNITQAAKDLSLLTTQLISCSLTPVNHLYGIRSLIFFGRL